MIQSPNYDPSVQYSHYNEPEHEPLASIVLTWLLGFTVCCGCLWALDVGHERPDGNPVGTTEIWSQQHKRDRPESSIQENNRSQTGSLNNRE